MITTDVDKARRALGMIHVLLLTVAGWKGLGSKSRVDMGATST